MILGWCWYEYDSIVPEPDIAAPSVAEALVALAEEISGRSQQGWLHAALIDGDTGALIEEWASGSDDEPQTGLYSLDGETITMRREPEPRLPAVRAGKESWYRLVPA